MVSFLFYLSRVIAFVCANSNTHDYCTKAEDIAAPDGEDTVWNIGYHIHVVLELVHIPNIATGKAHLRWLAT